MSRRPRGSRVRHPGTLRHPPGARQACAIIVGGVGSVFLFDFAITPRFVCGVALVILSIFVYGAREEQARACGAAVVACLACERGRSPHMGEAEASRPLLPISAGGRVPSAPDLRADAEVNISDVGARPASAEPDANAQRCAVPPVTLTGDW